MGYQKRLGIVVGGGPAPGINAVIGAATIEAINQGFEVVGLYDGFRWLCAEKIDPAVHTIRLKISDVARIHFDGGSILRTSRTNLLDESRVATTMIASADPAKVGRVMERLAQLGINHLVTIGGDDTALSARFIAEWAKGAVRVAHVPKTIDNDLPLPHHIPTFGFSSARFYGTQIVKNLMQDSLTTGRWYLVIAMGRSAGWLALAIGQAAGSTLSLIPEEFGETTTLQRIADVLEGAMLKRRAMGRLDGVAVCAEGLAYRLGVDELQKVLGKAVPCDAAGHPRLSEVPLGDLLKKILIARFAARGEKLTLVTHTLGYELRSADPTPGDMAYCRSLGYGCIRLLMNWDKQHDGGAMVTLVNGNLVPMPFDEMIDPATNRIGVRQVNVRSDEYRVARAYMIRLERSDLDNPEMLGKLAAEAQMTPEAFRERFTDAATRMIDGLPAE